MDTIKEMRRNFILDKSAIEMFQQGATGIWETFQGELYVAQDNSQNVPTPESERSERANNP